MRKKERHIGLICFIVLILIMLYPIIRGNKTKHTSNSVSSSSNNNSVSEFNSKLMNSDISTDSNQESIN